MEGLSTTKTKKFRVKHPKRKLYRSSEPLLSVFMWGINHTVRELSHISIPVMLMPDDFRAYSKIKIDNHAFNKENLPSHFKVSSFLRLAFISHSYIHMGDTIGNSIMSTKYYFFRLKSTALWYFEILEKDLTSMMLPI